ncbi:hypothetical protein B566_EDAN011525 [Ephemera danica]|nr:hypothetical protein B566_EDAN011525 [Ephemera danica]
MKDDSFHVTLENIRHVLNKLNAGLFGSYTFTLEDGRVLVTPVDEENSNIRFSETLALQLGYDPSWSFASGVLLANLEPNLNAGLPTLLYVQSNVVQPQFRGCTASRLLRVMSLNAEHLHRGSTVCLSVQHPQYLPVANKVLDHIEIDIKDASGIPLPFQCGRSSSPKGELDLFALPPTQLSIDNAEVLHYKPMVSLESDAPIAFSYQLTFLFIKAHITDAAGEKIGAADAVGPVNNFLYSMFSDVVVSLNGKMLSSPCNLFGYRKYLEILYNYNLEAKGTHQTMSLFSKDSPCKMDDLADNEGLKTRSEHTEAGKTVSMLGRLDVDILGQNKYLVNGVSIGVNLARAKSSFCLMSSGASKYDVKITDATLLVRRMKLAQSVALALEKVLLTSTAKYATTRVEMKSYTVPSGLLTFNMDNIFMGQLPVRLICVMTSNESVNGSYKKNPYNFKHYDINFLNLTKDGAPLNSKPFQLSFSRTSPDFIQSYFSTFQGTGIGTKDDGYDISRTEYPNGYFANVYDLTVDGSASSHQWSLRKNGTIGLEAHFTNALPEAINVIIYGEFQNLIEIDHERRITTDY